MGHRSDGPPSGGDSAELAGTLELRGGCVVVETDAHELIVPSFPLGWTKLDEETSTLTWGGNTSARLGEHTSMRGGYVDMETMSANSPEALGCAGSVQAFVVAPEM